MQVYKLFGSSDMIGNPLNLVDKMGTGVFEFFNEPRKGLLKGPEQFVGGVGKGVKGLVSNVVSGSFDSVSKITGSLYGVVKNFSGSEEEKKQNKPKHAFDGVYKGVTGGVGEIASGISGIFTKPVQMSQQEGASGFFKGVTSGMMGAITSPVTGVLKAGSNISEGVSQSARQMGNKGKQMIEDIPRVRPPRYMQGAHILGKFDANLSKANTLLLNTKFKNHSILFYCPVFKELALKTSYTMILTRSHVLVFRADKQIVFKAKQVDINKVNLKQADKEVVSLDIFKKSQKAFPVFQKDAGDLGKVFDILGAHDDCKTVDGVRK